MPGNFFRMLPTGLASRGMEAGSNTFGMPNVQADDGFHEAFVAADEMKKRDLMRQKELMAFQQQQALMARAPQVMQQKLAYAATKNPANKNYVLGAGSGTGKLPPSTVEADNAARDAKAAQMNKEFAAVNEAREQRAATLASAEKVAGMNANAKLAETDRKGWTVVNRLNPITGQAETFRMNNATGEAAPINYEGSNFGGAAKLGTKLPVKDMPKDVAGIRAKSQETVDAIDELLDPSGKGLSSTGSAVSGKSNWFGLAEYYPGEARKGATYVNNIKSKLLIDLMGQLKAQSKTGATGFGNMSDSDRKAIEAAVSRIDTGMADEDFEKELRIVRNTLTKYMDETSDEAWKKHPSNQQGNIDLTQPVGQQPQAQPAAPAKRDVVWKNPKTGVYQKKLDADEVIAGHAYGGK